MRNEFRGWVLLAAMTSGVPASVLFAALVAHLGSDLAASADLVRNVVGDRAVWRTVVGGQIIAWMSAVVLFCAAASAICIMQMSGGKHALLMSVIALPAAVAEVVRLSSLYQLLMGSGGSSVAPDYLFTARGGMVAYALIYLPLAMAMAWGVARHIDKDTEDVARALGASRARTLIGVTLPQLWPGVAVSVFVLAQLISSDVLVPRMIAGTALPTFAVLIQHSVFQARSPASGIILASLQTLLSLVIAVTLAVVGRQATGALAKAA